MLTPNGKATATTLTITDGASTVSGRGAAGANIPGGTLPQLLLATWIAAILGWLYLRFRVRSISIVTRYAALAFFALILLTGSILSGCALSVTSSPSTNASQLTVTATSGTLSQQFGITLTVTH
jgi:FtsH-binding integral membrane protein